MLMCGVGAKSVAHLMKFHLLQWEVVKVKFLMNSNITLTVLNLHQKTDPSATNFKGQGQKFWAWGCLTSNNSGEQTNTQTCMPL